MASTTAPTTPNRVPQDLPDYIPAYHVEEHDPELSLPPGVDGSDPLALFDLFFPQHILQQLAANTNKYAADRRAKKATKKKKQRAWEETTAAELRVYFGILIYMGIHPGEQETAEYWSTADGDPLYLEITRHMSRVRFEQLQRYFHISAPVDQKIMVFEKLEPLSSHLKRTSQQLWKAGTHVAVDESMTSFTGRSSSTVKMPNKPILEGFKIWVLGQGGYVIDWIFHAKTKGPISLDQKFTKDFSNTQAAVLTLLAQLQKEQGKSYMVWLDNLFTSARLFERLVDEGYGAAGTARVGKTSGIHEDLAALKLDKKRSRIWGEIHGRIGETSPRVLQISWEDSATVLIMTTVYTGKESIIRKRKKPSNTSSNARVVRVVFDDHTELELPIPLVVDHYNYYMNAVDIADQLVAAYKTQRTHFKDWKALFYWLFDVALINCYKIAQRAGHWKKQRLFRKQLAKQLIRYRETTKVKTTETVACVLEAEARITAVRFSRKQGQKEAYVWLPYL
ncbi:hypothetical protein B0A49_11802 [Cryomyces minteri]|uniref:PiggyBac transposable element-derived protein domain-containing protein n=1 Tax=Cryomyces minteri TaxID=331657 RepID=A0A4V5NFN2_9PEZI|nr:hypothetical protein B0A49_11802 [Cryomyces minteri]